MNEWCTITQVAEWLTSLKTDTPQEGFELAIKLARKGVAYTQPSADVLKKYARNTPKIPTV